MHHSRVTQLIPCLTIIALLTTGATLRAEGPDGRRSNSLTALRDRLDVRPRFLFYGIARDVETSGVNADNILDITSTELRLDVRPSITADFDRLQLSMAPRLELHRRHWDEGPHDDETDWETDVFIHEWEAQLEPIRNLFLAYGRQDLQWGPSYLISPSNPFNADNGRNQPKQELPAADYARITWTPHYAWTASLIMNTDEGRRDIFIPFEPTYALKIDHLMMDKYVSVILSKRESGDARGGFFASWNVNDAVIVYGEAGIANNDAELLVGSSYTFAMGGTVFLEYFYNEDGDPDDLLFNAVVDGLEDDPREGLFRRHYMLLQYVHPDIIDRLDLSLRAILNMDDESGLLVALGEYGIGDYTQFFVTGTVAGGSGATELGSLIDYEVLAGFEVTF